MEEKYLYTIAIIVIFAGFLFTSVGNYTGRISAVQAAREAEVGLRAGPTGCLDSEEGFERVVDQNSGSYVVCKNGLKVKKFCHPGEKAIQRGNYVVCLG